MSYSSQLPVVTFPNELTEFVRTVEPTLWNLLPEDGRRLLATLGTKLEPIVQVEPQTPVPLVIGFENLALGALGENFSQICRALSSVDAGLIRLVLALSAMRTTEMLCATAAHGGHPGVRRLLFTINLDPEMLESRHLDELLDRYERAWSANVLFEVNERTTTSCLRRLKDLQADFNIRYCADDFNNWREDVKEALVERIEMSKVDHATLLQAMQLRGDHSVLAIEQIARHKIADKPLIVEGIEDMNYLRFLNRHWVFSERGYLYGQGYALQPGYPWDTWTGDLREYGLPGGHIFRTRRKRPRELVHY